MKYLPEIAAGALLLAVLAAAVGLQEANGSDTAAAPNDPTFAIRGARVFDGERMLAPTTVLVRDGLIVAVGDDAVVPAGIEVIDGSGKTLLPGLIDAHVHAWGPAQRDALRFGVTTGLDMMGDRTRSAALRNQRESLAATDQADLWSAGAAVTAPGGHGTQYGMQVPTLEPDGEAKAFVDARVAEGSDYIKIIVEDMSAYGGNRRLPTLSPAQVAASIQASHEAGRLAVVHASLMDSARHAIDAGADGLVHVFQDQAADAGFVQATVQANAFVVPTLSVVAMIAGASEGPGLATDPRLQPWLSAEQVASLQGSFGVRARPQLLEHAMASVRALHAAGVPILAGTDAGNPGTSHGAGMHGELALLVQAGLTPVQALASATSLPAASFGLADRGRIAPGLRADLVMVEGDPSVEIAATRAIAGIWKNGLRMPRPTTAAAAAAQPAAARLGAGTLVSDFEDGDTDVAFGSGWQTTTDQMAGGQSSVTQAWVAGGANGSKGALQVSGEVKPGFPFPWAGSMFFTAATAMEPVDASERTELVFQVKGDGRQYNAMLFSGASGQGMPAIQPFTAGPEWTEVRLPLSGFSGADLARMRAVALTAGRPQGNFTFVVDQVELR